MAVCLPRFGERGCGSAHRESCPAEMPRRVACTAGLRQWPPERCQILGLSCDGSKGTGDWCAPEPVDSKKRRYACNEIKLPAKYWPDRA